jgi:hypothetical protein
VHQSKLEQTVRRRNVSEADECAGGAHRAYKLALIRDWLRDFALLRGLFVRLIMGHPRSGHYYTEPGCSVHCHPLAAGSGPSWPENCSCGPRHLLFIRQQTPGCANWHAEMRNNTLPAQPGMTVCVVASGLFSSQVWKTHFGNHMIG